MCFTDNAFVRVAARNRFPTTPAAVLRADPAPAGPRRPAAPCTEAHGAIKDSDNDGKAYVLDRCVYLRIIKIKISPKLRTTASRRPSLPPFARPKGERGVRAPLHARKSNTLATGASSKCPWTNNFYSLHPQRGHKKPREAGGLASKAGEQLPLRHRECNREQRAQISSSLPLFVSPGKSLSKGIYSRCISGSKLQHPPGPRHEGQRAQPPRSPPPSLPRGRGRLICPGPQCGTAMGHFADTYRFPQEPNLHELKFSLLNLNYFARRVLWGNGPDGFKGAAAAPGRGAQRTIPIPHPVPVPIPIPTPALSRAHASFTAGEEEPSPRLPCDDYPWPDAGGQAG